MLALRLRVTELSSSRSTPSRIRPLLRPQSSLSRLVGIHRRSLPTKSSASYLKRVKRLPKVPPIPLQSSSWPLFAILSAALAAAILLDPYLRNLDRFQSPSSTPPLFQASTDQPAHYAAANSVHLRTPSYSEMASPGHLGNLTPEQELKLRELWSLTLKIFGVKDPSVASAAPGIVDAAPSASEPNSESEATTKSSKKTDGGGRKRHMLFGRKKQVNSDDDKNSIDANVITAAAAAADEGDKYGQTKDFQQTLKEMSPEELRSAFWTMVKCDHPDALLLRFLRARKWDVQRALVMLVSTMRWRSNEMHVDDDIMCSGESGALADSKGDDSFAKKEGEDFLTQLRKGKTFLHGMDKDGRPICYVRARLHRQGEQSERAIERFVVFVIETARLMVKPPVETATLFFDLTSFTLSNMDYAPVKFIIKIFEANYPESLGVILVHKAPWVFQGIWAIIKGWLDPVVAAKVHFTKTIDDLENFIPRSQIIRELGGDEDWEYRYVEPMEEEKELMKDVEGRRELEEQRNGFVVQYQDKTFAWIAGAANQGSELAEERDRLAERLRENYWALDPFIRARTLYDRQGIIRKGGVIDFYPEQQHQGEPSPGGVNGSTALTSTTPSSDPAVGDGKADDVD